MKLPTPARALVGKVLTWDHKSKSKLMQSTDTKIMIVDDEPDILEFLGYNLRNEGFQVISSQNPEEVSSLAAQEMPQMILLDVMMPGMDGVTLCHQLRRDSKFDDTSIVFLTARKEPYSEMAGLKAGADDYIHKPVRPRLLLSRINAILRRQTIKEQRNRIQLEDLTLDRDRFIVVSKDQEYHLAVKEFEILWLLGSKPGKVFTRATIYSKIWGGNVIVGKRTIDVHISKIRTKLKRNVIKTVKGVGYKIDC